MIPPPSGGILFIKDYTDTLDFRSQITQISWISQITLRKPECSVQRVVIIHHALLITSSISHPPQADLSFSSRISPMC